MPKLSRIFPILALAAATFAFAIAPTDNLLDLNTATPTQLRALPGMGDAYVQRILENRPYTAKNQLLTRGILPQSAYARIAAYIIAKHPSPH
jgi:competence protein ComEA